MKGQKYYYIVQHVTVDTKIPQLYSFRFFFVGKKDGGLRPCIDYRGLNNITVKNRAQQTREQERDVGDQTLPIPGDFIL
ncbi:hypothetical protein AAFF_G00318370 [Aldrovandia affinis]|uniref:Uncharacterized protein n=1 Tax=Aldrovandia affinis TaxID=143900 RepID=A0AAD7SMM2_9TELE|nr:hypothetical protein AAFF_G00318370 [Aldrovandia affinis]